MPIFFSGFKIFCVFNLQTKQQYNVYGKKAGTIDFFISYIGVSPLMYPRNINSYSPHKQLTSYVLVETCGGIWTQLVSGLRHVELSRLKCVASAPLLVSVMVREIVWPTTCEPKSINWLSTFSQRKSIVTSCNQQCQ